MGKKMDTDKGGKKMFKQTQSASGFDAKQRKMLPGQRLLRNNFFFAFFAPSLCCNTTMQHEILNKAPHDFRSHCGCDRQPLGETSDIEEANIRIGSFEDSINGEQVLRTCLARLIGGTPAILTAAPPRSDARPLQSLPSASPARRSSSSVSFHT